MSTYMPSHKCGLPIKKLTRTAKNTKNTITIKNAIGEAVSDQETGMRHSASPTFRPEDTHLNIEVLPNGVTNSEELVQWFDDQISKYEEGYVKYRRVKDKETGLYKTNPDGSDYLQEYKAKLRKDACVGFAGIIKPPCEVISQLSYEDQLEYFNDALEIIQGILQEGDRRCTITSFQIHFDEGMNSGEGHCHYQGLAFDSQGALTCKNVIDVRLKQQFNTTFADKMQERGWSVERTAAYIPPDVTGMTPEEKKAARKQARADAKAERMRRGTWYKSGLNPSEYAKVIKAERAAEEKMKDAETREVESVALAQSVEEKSIRVDAMEQDATAKLDAANKKSEQLDLKESDLVKRENAIADAYKWMKGTKQLDGLSLDMSVWEYYQEHLGGGKKSTTSKTKDAKRADNTKKVAKPKTTKDLLEETRERNKKMSAEVAQAKEKLASEIDYSKGFDNVSYVYETSNSPNKEKYEKGYFEQLWKDTESFRADLSANACEDVYRGTRLVREPIKDANTLRKKVTSVLKKHITKLNDEQLNFGLVEVGIRVAKDFVSNFREKYEQHINKQAQRIAVDKSQIEQSASPQDEAQIGE